MAKMGIAVLTLLLSASAAAAQTRPEYPEYDTTLAETVRRATTAKEALRTFASAPDDPETLRLLLASEHLDEALRVFRTIISTRPERIVAALEKVVAASYSLDSNQTRPYRDLFRDAVADAKARIPALPREDAAAAARVLIDLEIRLHPTRSADGRALLQRFAEDHAGTEAALLTQVDVMTWRRSDSAMLDELDAFIARHPGTVAAAKALFRKASQLQAVSRQARGSDPTEGFMQALDIVKELESGRYPPCEWVQRAPELVTMFSSMNATYSESNVDRMIAAYTEIAQSLLAKAPANAIEQVRFVITGRLGELLARRGDPLPGIESVLTLLERNSEQYDAARYVRGLVYARDFYGRFGARLPEMQKNAKATFGELVARASGTYSRRALADLASLEFHLGEYAPAREHYRRYAAAYPQSPIAWLAAFRAAQASARLDDHKTAAAEFMVLAKQFGDVPAIGTLGHANAARSFESIDRFDDALRHYLLALNAWDDASGVEYHMFTPRQVPAGSTIGAMYSERDRVRKDELRARVGDLTATLAEPDGELVARGRRLIEAEQPGQATDPLRRFLQRHPRARLAAEARYLLHQAQWQQAIALADVSSAKPDVNAAMAGLDALVREPYDFAVFAAKIAKACLLLRQGSVAHADTLTADALGEWQAHQKTQPTRPVAGIERDVLDIWNAVFLPAGGGIYAGQRWNAFTFSASAPYRLVHDDVRVKLPSGAMTVVAREQPFPDISNVLFISREQAAFFTTMLDKLGGTKTRPPRAVMETPNQPIGDAVAIMESWNRHFPIRPGHWGGWELFTYPVVTQIEFLNPEATRAAARVTIGYSGATVMLEKVDGRWIAKELVNFWIT